MLLLVVAIAPSIGAVSALWLWPGSIGGGIYVACKCILYGIPAVVAWKSVDGRSVLQGIKRGLAPVPLAFALGSAVLFGGVVLLAWNLYFRESLDLSNLKAVVAESGLDRPAAYLLMALWLSTGNALLEEFVFRWFVDSRLRLLGTPIVAAIALSGFIFTAHHILVLAAYFPVGPTIIFSMGIFIGGVCWSLALRRWHSLMPGWISHAFVDMAVFLVGWQMLFG